MKIGNPGSLIIVSVLLALLSADSLAQTYRDRYFRTNGQCGSASGVSISTAPTSGLCAVGAASGAVSAADGTGPWYWTCAGSNGGTTASCSAPELVQTAAQPAQSTAQPGQSTVQSGQSTEQPGLSTALSASPPYTCVRNFYVDPVNGKDHWINPGSQALPWLNLQTANDSGVLRPGDCVNVLPGSYNISDPVWLNRGGNTNSPTGYVVYRSTTPQAAKIVAGPGVVSVIGVQVPYLIIDGFEINGNNNTVEYAVANADSAHHIAVINNVIHNSLGGGIGFAGGEYFYILHNVVYSTSATALEQESGISIWQPNAVALANPTDNDSTPFHIKIEYNISHDNFETFSCGSNPGCHTDGNGIILDFFCCGSGGPYPYQTLVLGNLVYGNGGKGVHVFHSANVTVANNTSYNNNLDTNNNGTWRPELSNAASSNNTWINNIAWAVPGPGILSYNSSLFTAGLPGSPNSGNTWSNNIGYGGPVVSDATDPIRSPPNLIGVNPQLTNPAAGDFTLLPNSPALGVLGVGSLVSSLGLTTLNIGAF